jgi:hypothetical protein
MVWGGRGSELPKTIDFKAETEMNDFTCKW